MSIRLASAAVALFCTFVVAPMAAADDVELHRKALSWGSAGNPDLRPDAFLSLDSVGERVCWFDGQKFSKGARIETAAGWLECARENDYEINGALSWRPVRGAASGTPGDITTQP